MANRRLGFTLMETLVALALSAVLLVSLAGASLAFMRTSSEADVSQRVQRELVYAAEAVEQVLKVAIDVTQPVSGVSEYVVRVVDKDTFAESAQPVTIALSGSILKVGSRTVSRNIQSFVIAPTGIAGVRRVSLDSTRHITFGKPVELSYAVNVVMRNNSAMGGSFGDSEPPEPPPLSPLALIDGPTVTPISTGPNHYSMMVTWQVEGGPVGGRLYFSGNPDGNVEIAEGLTQVTVSQSFHKNRTYSLRLVLQDATRTLIHEWSYKHP